MSAFSRSVINPGCANDGVAAFLNLSDELNSQFFYYLLFSWIQMFRTINQGMGQPNLNTTLLSNLKIPIPPISEQREIAKILENSDEQIMVIKNYLENTHNLRKTLLRHFMNKNIKILEAQSIV